MVTYWLEGYKIAANSLTQAKMALELLKKSGTKPDFKTLEMMRAEGFAACYPNNMQECA